MRHGVVKLVDWEDSDMMRQCNTDPCLNGGYCSTLMTWEDECKQKCACLPGFGGRRCEIGTYVTTSDLRLDYDSVYKCVVSRSLLDYVQNEQGLRILGRGTSSGDFAASLQEGAV